MSNRDENQEFSLDDILNEFLAEPEQAPEEAPAQEAPPAPQQITPPAAPQRRPAAPQQMRRSAAPQQARRPAAPVQKESFLDDELAALLREDPEEAQPQAPSRDTVRLEKLSDVPVAPKAETPQPEPAPVVIELDPKARLRDLKKKLIAGPEKRYYDLSELGLGKFQTSIFVNLLIVVLCAAVTTLYAMDMVPESRLRLVIFSQVLAMLVSAWLGCQQMLDGLGDLLKFRFTANTMLAVTFLSCCVDAVFCLRELRIPCCAAFCLEMTLAQLSCYHRRATQMAQMDTLRKAVRLHSLVKVPNFFEGKAGILRGYGDPDHFMNNYEKTTAPETVQNVFAFVAFALSIGVAAFAGLTNGTSMAIQIFSTSLLVAMPASYFIALTRPASVLQKRLHMVGTVLCGWQGVKGLKGKAAFPLKDEDLFPTGSTKLNGVKFYGDRTPDEVITCAAALICAAGGGLVHVFRQLLKSRGGRELPVKNFQNYGGGIGGEVAGESVLLGSAQFLQDMGVAIPQGTDVAQAVYVAVDGELGAVVAISYGKMRSASGGIVSLSSNRKLTPVMVGGDFMLTEALVRSKFNINTRRVAFPQQLLRYQLAQVQPDPNAPALALVTRDDLISYAYAITGARALRRACTLGTIVHIFGGILGILIMLALAFLGNTELLNPTNILLYQLVWLLPGMLITEWTRTV